VFIGSWHGDAAYIYLHLAALFTLACQIFRAGGAGAAYKASVGCAFKAFGPGSASYEKNQRQGKNQADTQRTVEQGVLRCEHHKMPEGAGVPVTPVHLAGPGGCSHPRYGGENCQRKGCDPPPRDG